METHTSSRRIDPPAVSRRRLLQLAAASATVGGLGLATGVARAQPLEDLCEAAQLDLMLVLDQSGTMSLGTPTRMARAKAGATALVDAVGVSTPGVHVGVSTFAGGGGGADIPVFQPLTDDPSVAKAAISSIPDSPGGGTNMEAGVQAGREELTGIDYSDDVGASGTHRPGVPSILVLLSDGEPNVDNDPADTDDPATFPTLGGFDPSEEAAAAKSVDGIEIYTIGIDLGTTAAALMEAMASEPTAAHAFPSVDVDRIEATFGDVAADICPSAVDIDVKPGSDPNAINCRATRNGVIPVAVLGSDTFDVTTLDAATLRFGSPSTVIGGGGATLAHGDGHLVDVDGDGFVDLVGHFPAVDAGFASGDVQGVLVGQTTGGETVAGVDSVKIVGRC